MNSLRHIALPGVLMLLTACASTSPETQAALDSMASTDSQDVQQSLNTLNTQARVLTLPTQACVDWVGKKKTGQHDGGFETCTGRVFLGAQNELLKLEIAVETASLFSDNFILTGHLKSEDFLEVKTFPLATFTSTQIEPVEQDRWRITGDFDVHGITHTRTFEATAKTGADGQWSGDATLSFVRSDHNISYVDETEKDPIADEVSVMITLSTAPSP